MKKVALITGITGQEGAYLSNVLEYTNEPYAIAKIAGIKLCQSYNLQYNTDYISLMPTNLYGPNDKVEIRNTHINITYLIKEIVGFKGDFVFNTEKPDGTMRKVTNVLN